jgi:hypothetical protein
MEMMLNPWIFGLEALQQGWQAQGALAFRLMRSFAGGVPDQTSSSPLIQDTVAVDSKAQEEAFAAIADVQRRKAPKVLRVSKRTSRVNPRSVSKRAAAASQNSASKTVRRSTRKPR